MEGKDFRSSRTRFNNRRRKSQLRIDGDKEKTPPPSFTICVSGAVDFWDGPGSTVRLPADTGGYFDPSSHFFLSSERGPRSRQIMGNVSTLRRLQSLHPGSQEKYQLFTLKVYPLTLKTPGQNPEGCNQVYGDGQAYHRLTSPGSPPLRIKNALITGPGYPDEMNPGRIFFPSVKRSGPPLQPPP